MSAGGSLAKAWPIYAIAAGLLLLLIVLFTQGSAAAPDISSGKNGNLPANPSTNCWEIVPSPNAEWLSNELHAIAAVSASDVWAVGRYQNTDNSFSETLTEHWNGVSWFVVPSPDSGLGDNTLSAVTAISASDVWAVGFGGSGPLIEHWNGASWSIVPAPGSGSLAGVAAVSANDVWAVGSYRPNQSSPTATLVEHWSGSAWSIVPSPNVSAVDNYLAAVAVVSANDVWAAGFYYTGSEYRTLAEHWNGAAWSVVPTPNLASGINMLTGVAVVSANDVWAVGQGGPGGLTGLTEHWNGTSWIVVPTGDLGIGGYLVAVIAISTNEVWAIGSYYNSNTHYESSLVVHWDGTAWSVIPSPNPEPPGNTWVVAGAAVSANDVWAVGYHIADDVNSVFQTLVEHYGDCVPTLTPSSTPTLTPTPTQVTLPYCWTSVPAPDLGHSWTEGSISRISAISTNDIWALAEYRDSQGAYHTSPAHWTGQNWSLVSIPVLPQSAILNDIFAISNNDVWVIGTQLGSNNTSSTLAIHWNGNRWTVVPSPNGDYLENSLVAIDGSRSDNVWAVGYSRQYEPPPSGTGEGNSVAGGLILRWNGSQWISIDTHLLGIYGAYNTVQAFSPTSVWVGGYTEQPYVQLLLYWNGTSWTDAISRANGIITSVRAISPTDVWASVDSGGYFFILPHFIHLSGSQWTLVSSQRLIVTQIEPVSANDIWATASDTLLHWDGMSWGRAPFQGDDILDLAAISSSDVWAVGSSNGRMLILHYNTSCVPTPAPTATPTPAPPPCPNERFTDVCPTDYFYPYVQALADDGILSGYNTSPPCLNSLWIPCFNPYNSSTRGQISKVVSLAAGFNEPVSGQTFQDVPPGSTFYTYTERMAERGIVSGYPCGSPSTPCVPPANLPYFRTNNHVTRGQLSKMVSLAFGWNDPVTGQTFQDVPPGSTFYSYIGQLLNRSIINGYPCGTPSRPCIPPDNRPYFMPNNDVTRGQTAKIVQISRTQPTATPTTVLTSTATTTPTATLTPAETVTAASTATPVEDTATPAPTTTTIAASR